MSRVFFFFFFFFFFFSAFRLAVRRYQINLFKSHRKQDCYGPHLGWRMRKYEPAPIYAFSDAPAELEIESGPVAKRS